MLYVVARHKKAIEKDKNNRENLGFIEKRAICEYMRYLKLLNHIKIDKNDYMTHKEFAEYVAEHCELISENEACGFAKMQEKAEYAKDLLTNEEVNQCCQYNDILRDKIYEKKNFVQKFIFKFIYNL